MKRPKFKKNGIKSIAKKHGIKLAVLFGSKAKKTAGLKNDLDIALLTKTKPSGQREYRMFKDFIQLLKSDNLDLVVLNFANPLIRFQVARDGKPLYEQKQGDFRRFQLRAIKDYWSNLKFMKLQNIYLNGVIKKL
jgi:predicted nucleotidyltransferase